MMSSGCSSSFRELCNTGTIPSLCIAVQNEKVCVKMPVHPRIYLSELQSLKKEMFQAHCFCSVHAMEM